MRKQKQKQKQTTYFIIFLNISFCCFISLKIYILIFKNKSIIATNE